MDSTVAQLEKLLDRKIGVIVEHFDNKFDSLIEAFQVITATMSTMARDVDLQEVKQDVKTIKIAVRATNDDVKKLEERFDGLEGRFDNLEQILA
jgi:hypothetical protein